MKPQFIETPSYYIADIGKAGSSTIYRAVLRTFHPDRVPRSVGYDMSNQPNDGGRNRVDRTTTPSGDVLMFVREPVERFRSACAQSRIEDVDELLTHLENGTGEAGPRKVAWVSSYHFRPQSDYRVTGQPTKAFKFPDHIDDFISATGLDELPVVNDASNNPPKPDLTPEQQARVETIYADDIALFNSITEAGQDLEVVEIPPYPATDTLKASKIRQLEAARYQAEVAGTTVAALGDAFVRTDKETQNELGKALALLTIDPGFEIDWKFPDGTIVHLAKAQIDAVAQAVFTHVQATRTTYKDKAALVEAATTKEELDVIVWE